MNLADIELFVTAVRIGSLAGAARHLGLTAMAASRRLAALEAELGTRLIHRTTRSLSPTGDGEVFLPHARALLESQASALAELRPDGGGLAGQLRITASSAFARRVVTPMLAGFMRAHPALQVDLLGTDDQVDIVAHGIDVAIRIAPLKDNRLVARRLADNRRLLCATRGYLQARGQPAALADLAAHDCLVATGASHWAFVREGRAMRQRVAGRFSASSIEVLFQACRSGLGIANVSYWFARPWLGQGEGAERLEQVVLADAEPEPLAIWAVYPSAQRVPPKVRLFIQALETVLERTA